METSSTLNVKGGGGLYPKVEGFCLARGKNLSRIKCFSTGVMIPFCWRGGVCSKGSCDDCHLCKVCQCECKNITRDVLHRKWDETGANRSGGAKGRGKKSDPRYADGASSTPVTLAAKELAKGPALNTKKQKRGAALRAKVSNRAVVTAEGAVELSADGKMAALDQGGKLGTLFFTSGNANPLKKGQRHNPLITHRHAAPARKRKRGLPNSVSVPARRRIRGG